MKNVLHKLKQWFSRIELPKIRISPELIGISVALLLISVVMFIPSFDFAPKHKLSTEKFISLCEKAGYSLEDTTGTHRPSFFLEVITDTEEDFTAESYTFTHRAFSKALYTHFLSTLQDHSVSEEYRYTASYNRFYKKTDEGVVFLYRNEETIILLSGGPEHIAAIDELIKKMKL